MQSAGIFVVLHNFGSTSTISRFGERFRDGQYSLASFLYAVLLTAPRVKPFVKVGGTCFLVPYGENCINLSGYLFVAPCMSMIFI